MSAMAIGATLPVYVDAVPCLTNRLRILFRGARSPQQRWQVAVK